MKAFIFLILLVIYLLIFSGYLIQESIKYFDFDRVEVRLWCWSSFGYLLFIIFLFTNFFKKHDTFLSKQWLLIGWAIVFGTVCVVIANSLLLITNPYTLLGMFYFANVFFCIVNLTSGVKYGIFKD